MIDVNLVNRKIKILKRINSFTELFVSSLPLLFNQEDIELIKTLVNEGKLTYIWDGDTPYSEEQKIVFTKIVQRMIFCSDNANAIIEFCNLLYENGYDNNFDLVMDFLDTQDLELNPVDILTIDNYKNFAIIYDRNILKPLDSNINKILKLNYR